MRDLIDELAAWLEAEAVDEHPDLIVGDVSHEHAERTFEALEEAGVLVRRHKLDELVEKRAQERLVALKQEHGLTV
jgi:hypothetical protein